MCSEWWRGPLDLNVHLKQKSTCVTRIHKKYRIDFKMIWNDTLKILMLKCNMSGLSKYYNDFNISLSHQIRVEDLWVGVCSTSKNISSSFDKVKRRTKSHGKNYAGLDQIANSTLEKTKTCQMVKLLWFGQRFRRRFSNHKQQSRWP